MVHPDELRRLVESHIPGSRVAVTAYKGDDHFDMTVVSPSFSGLTRLARHRRVYEALGDHMRQAIHALSLKTLTPDETA